MEVLHFDMFGVVRMATRLVIERNCPESGFHEASNVSAFTNRIREQTFDLIILEIKHSKRIDFDLIPQTRTMQPAASILVFSEVDESIYGLHLLKQGADAFVPKSAEIEILSSAIRVTSMGGKYISPRLKHQFLGEIVISKSSLLNPLLKLSFKELMIMEALLEGRYMKEIAYKLGLSESSVSSYKTRIFRKLNCVTVIDLQRNVAQFKADLRQYNVSASLPTEKAAN